jgi:beta-phosphoglucomutase-like phosphatase (HAD superfamily)
LWTGQDAPYPEDRSCIEDSRYGVAGAKAAGMKAIGFAGGITPVAHLVAADVVITDMADLSSTVSLLLG